MTFLAISFIAGVLTVLAPCILPLLPVVVGSSVSGRSKVTPYIVVASLAVSTILFTFLLKASTAFIMVPPEFWTYLSGGILLLFGLTLVFPELWERIPGMAKFSIRSNKLLGAGHLKNSVLGDVLVGAALGPVFSSCSPTYFVILASVLPASFFLGTLYLLAYTLGLGIVLLCIALLGEKFSSRLSGFSDPRSKFKRGLGVLFVVLGIFIAMGYEKKLETALLNSGFLDVTKLETILLQKTSVPDSDIVTSTGGIPYKEIVRPGGFVNTNDQPITLADYVGKKVILLDVMTYSCINCQRTFPYAVAWYEKYKDSGLIIIGIHTPEFAFEKNKKNVEEAMKKFGITFPVVLDNDYGTWNAYGNNYWPRKYLIDIHGNVVYDHIGEGGYEETEIEIRTALDERAKLLEESASIDPETPLAVSTIPKVTLSAQSPETYLGSARNEFLGNGIPRKSGTQNFTASTSASAQPNTLFLGGTWNITDEYATSVKDSKIIYHYKAGDVYLVMSADTAAEMEVWQDGVLVTDAAGADVNTEGVVRIQESRLYKLIHNSTPGEHILELRIRGEGAEVYAFTFG